MIQKSVDYLGFRGRDLVTGYSGVIDSVCFDLYGCIQVSLKPQDLDKDGQPKDGRWFDINRIYLYLDKDRVLPIPSFGAKDSSPENYDHGPADKPLRRG